MAAHEEAAAKAPRLAKEEDEAAALKARALALHARYPLFDGHNDLPILYTMRANGNLSKLPFRGNLEIIARPTHTDLARMRRGMVGAGGGACES